MKQSTKLLSLVLALIMAFSCLSVVGSAKPADLTQSNMTYDSVDDAIISGEIGATILLNYLEATVMPDLGVIDLSVLGELNLTSVNNLFSSFHDLLDNGLLAIVGGDVGNLRANRSMLDGVTREQGDLAALYALLGYLGSSETVSVLKKAPKGLLTSDGIGLGSLLNGIVKGLFDVGSINDILTDINGMVTDMVFDMLVYGSQGYDKDAEELGTLPSEVNTVDKILDIAIGGLLTQNQDYEWEGEGEAAVKVWKDSKVMPTLAAEYETAAAAGAAFSLSDSNNSIFSLLDKLAPYAIYDLGITPLNNNLKKALMEAVEADIDEIPVDKVPSDAQTAFEVETEAGKESYVTYISYDKMFKSSTDNEWYYTTLESEVVGEETKGDEVVEITEKVRKYFKVNMAAANDFADLINFNWNITAPKPGTTGTGAINEIDYAAIIKTYGSIAQSLNHLVYIVAKNALSDTAVKAFNKVVIGDENANQDVWVDGATSATSPDGKSTVFVYNIERILKFLLAEYADKIFGADSEYVAWEYSDVKDMTIVELVAHIGPTFFEDVMPQLIIPKDANGRAAFHEGVEILEFGALVLREFMTEIAPNVNYDADIFAEGTLTSATGRQFKDYGATAKEDWFNLILNMGTDVACVYLNQLTNFEDYCKQDTVFTSAFDLDDWVGTGKADGAHWNATLDTIIMWAVNYVSDGTNSVIAGLEPATVAGVSNYGSDNQSSLKKLSYILHTVLPILGLVNNCTSDTYEFDVEMLFAKLKDLFQNFNLDAIVSLFGRNTHANSKNILNSGDIVSTVLNVANNLLTVILRTNLLGTTESVNAVLQNDNLSGIIERLLTALASIDDKLLPSALPVVCKLIKDLGGEQELGTPNIALGNTVVLSTGALSEGSFTVLNGSTGLWRGYKTSASATSHSKDNHYAYNIKSIKAYNFDGVTESSYIKNLAIDDANLGYGEKGNVTYSVEGVSNPGVVQKFEITYTVTDEAGNEMAGGKQFKISKYVWLNYDRANDGDYTEQSYEINLVLKKFTITSKCKTYIYCNNDPETLEGTVESFEVAHVSKPSSTFTFKAWVESNQTKEGIYLGHTTNQESTKEAIEDGIYFEVQDVATAANYAKTPGASLTFDITLKASSNSYDATSTIRFYDGVALAKLSALVGDETGAMRKKADYHTDDAEYYASRLLRTQNVDDDRLIETTSTKTAWIDDDKNVYDETELVANKTATKYYEGTQIVEAMTGIVEKDGKNIPVKKVTVLNGNTVWTAYESALQNGIRGAWQVWNDNSTYEHQAYYEALYRASAEVEQLKLTDEERFELGTGDSIDDAVNTLETTLDSVEAQYSDTKDYTDYRMYRWNRYNDVREDARDIVNAKKAASFASPDSKYFPYTWVSQTDVNGIIKNEANEAYIGAYVGGTDGLSFISELLEDYSEEEMAQREEDLKNAKIHYANIDALEVAQAQNLLERVPGRLLPREHGIIKTHLENEIASALAMIGDSDDDGNYTYRSWVKYENALKDAIAVRDDANASQMQIFDAKWELLCCRNELVLADFEADYSELEALIDQATTALANQDLYDNTAKELGQVLAELGLGYEWNEETEREEFIQVALANGETVDLFPGSAHYINHEPYSKEDQDVIDNKANELKEALARLKFKKTNVELDGTFEDVEIKAADPENDIEAEIISNVARIAAMQDEDTVKDLFNATDASAMEIVNKVVSNDIYSVEKYDENGDLIPFKGFVGTNATLTLYADIDGYYVPVATIKLVVDGDVNGDGVVDVLDANLAQLVSTDHGELNGCFFVAGNLDSTGVDTDGNQKVDALDYSEVVNVALAS